VGFSSKETMAEDTTLHTEGERTPIVTRRRLPSIPPRRLFQPGGEARKYRLKVPTFAGIEDVEQFVSEFHETWDITQWPPRVALAKLRGALTGEAKPYGQRPSIDGIFVALRARFGITTLDARLRLHRLLRSEDTSLQDHALAVKRLARIAYSDLPETRRQHYMLEDFTQSLNYPSLTHYLQARGVTFIAAALREGEGYLEVQRLYETPTKVTRPQEKRPATTTNTTLEAAAGRLITVMTGAVTALSSLKPPVTSFETPTRHRNWKPDGPGHQPQMAYHTHLHQTPANRGDLRDPASRARRVLRVASAGRPYGLRGTPPMGGKHPGRLEDPNGRGNSSHCLSLTASASYL